MEIQGIWIWKYIYIPERCQAPEVPDSEVQST